MSNFFIYEALIIEQQLDITGFELYSPGHLIWLAAIVIVSIIASISYRRSSGRERDRTRRFFALAILIAEICKDLILAMAGAPDDKVSSAAPVQLCDNLHAGRSLLPQTGMARSGGTDDGICIFSGSSRRTAFLQLDHISVFHIYEHIQFRISWVDSHIFCDALQSGRSPA